MPARFEPVIKSARFDPRGVQAQQMLRLGNVLLASIQARLDRGETIYDAPARPLKDSYQRRKQRLGGASIRDLQFSGRMRRSLKVLEAGRNYAIIGPTDQEAANRLRWNQRRERQWGVSPVNERDLSRAIASSLTSPMGVLEERTAA